MAVKFLADENLKGAILQGLRHQQPNFDVVRVQDVGLSGVEDPEILEWSARENRVLLTHDVSTMTKYAYKRIAIGLPMSGALIVPQKALISLVIEEILILAEFEAECWGQVRYLPL